ncbi:MAG TPA: hypothetical protein VMQ81_04545 [Acidimicrobiia bacterium]|jgi:hypothetical protein|nr:hypothetical protein [Acidimicrobiia bacterium]
MSTKTRAPRFNHVAMSVPADLLDEKGRGQLLQFYGDVFGWEELPTETLDRKRLVMRAYSNEQFVFLIAEDPPMTCPRLDHFGMSVDTMEELDDMLERARAFQSRDDRVDIVDKSATDHDGFLVLTSFYVGYLLPMMIEVQHYDWAQQ